MATKRPREYLPNQALPGGGMGPQVKERDIDEAFRRPTLPGSSPIVGATGAAGSQGPPGPPGPPGPSAPPVAWSSDGEDGADGETGPVGATGPQGPAGGGGGGGTQLVAAGSRFDTADTLENTVVDFTVAANTLLANGRLRFTMEVQVNGTGTKVVRGYFGGVKWVEEDQNQNANRDIHVGMAVFNEGATNKNGIEYETFGVASATATPPIATTGNTFRYGLLQDQAVDTTLAQHFKVTVQKGIAGDTFTVLNWQLWFEPHS